MSKEVDLSYHFYVIEFTGGLRREIDLSFGRSFDSLKIFNAMENSCHLDYWSFSSLVLCIGRWRPTFLV